MNKNFLLSFLFSTILFSCSGTGDEENIKDPIDIVVDNKQTIISSVTPFSAKKNTLITIKGENLGTSGSTVKIFFGDREATIQSIKDDEIVVVLPNKITDGTIKIVKDQKDFILKGFEYIPTATVTYVRKSTDIYTNNQLFANQIAIDKLGNIYMTLGYTEQVDKISSNGEYLNIIEDLFTGYASAITTDNNNNVYISDVNGYLYKVTPSGIMTRVVNNNGDLVKFSSSTGMCFDSKNNLFIAEFSNNRILKFSSLGILSIFSGEGAGSTDGNISVAKFREPSGIVCDAEDNLYISEYKNNRIRKISSNGIVSTLAGSAVRGRIDGVGSEATFNGPRGITIDKNNNLFITDSDNNAIRMLTPKRRVITISGGSYGDKNGIDLAAEFANPRGIAINPEGILFIGDNGNGELRKIILD